MNSSSADDTRYDRRELLMPPDLDPRLHRSWQRIATQIEARARPPRSRLSPALAWGAACAAAAACLFVFWPWHSDAPSSTIADARVVRTGVTEHAAQNDARMAAAPDSDQAHAELSMEPNAEVAVLSKSAKHTQYRLARGQATFEAPSQSSRSVGVEVGGMKLLIVSSRVTVLSSGTSHPLIEVFVEKGNVTIEGRGRTRHLTRGQRLVLDGELARPSLRSRRHGQGKAEPPIEGAEPSLLDVAGSERRAGRFEAAARAYEQMLRSQPDDPRAPLASFELGRLRMDHLNDLRGAIAPLQRAATSAGSSATREDAVARLVRVFDRLNDQSACSAERANYLARFAQGVHAVEMEQRCKGKR